ncbi:Iron-sulfur protein required for NADH dehydrogenase, mitochondrial, partial [Linum perenne]
LQRLGSVRQYAGPFSRSKLRLDGVKDVIAVASGKGGVGKSTTAVNLAVAFANKCNLKVGLLDADVYGPSVPLMMKIDEKPGITEDRKMIPIENYGVRCMSMGFLVDQDAPIVWRGPMVMSALEKMTRGVSWGNLDILVVDMPPGTGDAQLTITQSLQLSGAVIISTPQDVALLDARRGVKMFSKVDVPILGFIENMSCFKCPHCDEPSYIFGKGGTQKMADTMGYHFIGEVRCIMNHPSSRSCTAVTMLLSPPICFQIPIEVDIRTCCDNGTPIVVSSPDSAVSKAYSNAAWSIVNKLEELAKRTDFSPEINL